MMTAGAPTINPRCEGQGPKSKPIAGDDEEEDGATMYTAVAEIRHASSACMDLSPLSTSYCSSSISCTKSVLFDHIVEESNFVFDGDQI